VSSRCPKRVPCRRKYVDRESWWTSPPARRERGASQDHFADRPEVPFNPLKDVAFHALDHTYSIGYAVCGASAVYAALLAVVALGGRVHAAMVTEESLAG
jgi:hypothetical protein